MRTFFYIVGIGTVILVAIVSACAGLLIYSSVQVNREGTAFANAAMVAITSKWDADALLSRASPDLIKTSSPERVRSLFDRLDALGAPARFQDCQNANISVFYNAQKKTTVQSSYNCIAQYANDSATINMLLVKRDGAWKISGFHVNSPIFAPSTMRKA